MNLDRGSRLMKMNSMPWQAVGGWTSQLGYPELAWQWGCKALHKDPNLCRNRLAQMTESELGASVLALGAASSGPRLPQQQMSITRRWTKWREGTWRWTSRVPWSSRTNLERFPLPGVPLSTSCHQIFVIRIRRSTTMQNQSQERTRRNLDWFKPSQSVIALRPVLLYYAMENLVAPDELRAATFIV
jgi:hypothetical protein